MGSFSKTKEKSMTNLRKTNYLADFKIQLQKINFKGRKKKGRKEQRKTGRKKKGIQP